VMSSIPVPPPMPPAEFWNNMDTSKYDAFYRDLPAMNDSYPTQSMRTMEVLPIEHIEKPVIIHESIRQEQVEEIQSVVRVEREKTEIRQITQPLTDKEIRPVFIEERTLPVEVLPTIVSEGRSVPERLDQSTREFDATMRQVVEKAPIIQETEKWRIIEEVQPIIYREVIIPHVIRTSRPMREVIVEAPIFSEQVLQVRDLSASERQRWSSFFTKDTVHREPLPAASIPFISIPEPQTLPVRSIQPVQSMPRPQKEIVEEKIITTTTTTTAPVVGSTGPSGSANVSNTKPVVVNESHDLKFGPHGEKITRDTFTTTSQGVLPTRAI